MGQISTITEVNPRLLIVRKSGASMWLDQIRRYDSDLERLARDQLDAVAIYERLVARNVQLAADGLAALHGAPGGREGFVSLEISPALATSRTTVETAPRLPAWR